MRSIVRAIYVVFALGVIGGYGYAAVRGVEMRVQPKRYVSQTVRGAHGGMHSFWYTGYRGGK
jgi:hypothetical protein